MRARVLDMIGGLPAARTPLNARIVGTIPMRRLSHREGDLREPARRARHRARLRPGRARRPQARRCWWPAVTPRTARASRTTRSWRASSRGAGTWSSAGIPWARASAASSGTRPAGAAATTSCAASTPSSATSRAWPGRASTATRSGTACAPSTTCSPAPDVDATRIAVTGTSGGGQQAAYLGALDERIGVVAPSCFITSHADAHGEPDLRGPRQRPRAGPARPGVGRHRPSRPAAARLPAAAHRRRGGQGLRAHRGRAAGRCASWPPSTGCSARAIASRSPRGITRTCSRRRTAAAVFAFLDRFNGLPPRDAMDTIEILDPKAAALHAVRAGARGPPRPVAARGHPRGLARARRPAPPKRLAEPRTAAPRSASGRRTPRAGTTVTSGARIDRYRLRHGALAIPLLHIHRPGRAARGDHRRRRPPRQGGSRGVAGRGAPARRGQRRAVPSTCAAWGRRACGIARSRSTIRSWPRWTRRRPTRTRCPACSRTTSTTRR